MKFLKCAIVILIFCFSVNKIEARRNNCHIKVCETGKTYNGRCSWFKLDRKAAINPSATNYVAMRWDYNKLAKHWNIKDKDKVKKKLKTCWVLVENPKTKKKIWAKPADWGPANWTGRAIDLDPKIMKQLKVETDDKLMATLFDKKPKNNV